MYLYRIMHNILVFITIIILLTSAGITQSTSRVVVSDIVGDTIDCVENETYALFPHISKFKHAVFIINHDSTLSAIVTVGDEDVMRDTVMPMRRTATSINNQIEVLFEQQYGISRHDTLARQDVICGGKKRGIIKVVYNNGRTIVGELIFVRPHAIIITPGINGWDKMNKTPKMLYAICRDSISEICTQREGRNVNTFLYTAAGALLGLAASIAIVKMNILPIPVDDVGRERGEYLLNYIYIITVFGAIIGNISANKTEEFGECAACNTIKCESWFAKYARYQHGEPPYLKQIMP
jgi:hypothetical protein